MDRAKKMRVYCRAGARRIHIRRRDIDRRCADAEVLKQRTTMVAMSFLVLFYVGGEFFILFSQAFAIVAPNGELVVEELESLAELDLFAEELPERLNNTATPMGSASTFSCAGPLDGCAACLSSLCSLA